MECTCEGTNLIENMCNTCLKTAEEKAIARRNELLSKLNEVNSEIQNIAKRSKSVDGREEGWYRVVMVVEVARAVEAKSVEHALEKADTDDMVYELKNYSIDYELKATRMNL